MPGDPRLSNSNRVRKVSLQQPAHSLKQWLRATQAIRACIRWRTRDQGGSGGFHNRFRPNQASFRRFNRRRSLLRYPRQANRPRQIDRASRGSASRQRPSQTRRTACRRHVRVQAPINRLSPQRGCRQVAQGEAKCNPGRSPVRKRPEILPYGKRGLALTPRTLKACVRSAA